MIYLSADEAATLLLSIGDLSASGSVVAFEYETFGADRTRQRAGQCKLLAPYTAIWKGGLRNLPTGWRRTRGAPNCTNGGGSQPATGAGSGRSPPVGSLRPAEFEDAITEA
jgi:hypothetical protein